MDKKFFEEIAKKIYVNPSDEVITTLEEEWNFLTKNINNLKEINIDNVEPFTRISPPISFDELRADIIDQSIYLDKKILLKNANESDDNFVIMKRIIK